MESLWQLNLSIFADLDNQNRKNYKNYAQNL